VHQLNSDPSSDVFSTHVFSKFIHVRRIHISFAPGWSLALVGPGMETLTQLETCEFRRIPAIAVTQHIPARTHVSLHAFDVMSTAPGRAVAPYASSLSLQCDDAPIDSLDDMLGDPGHFHSLMVGCTGMLTLPRMDDMISLKHLHIWTTIYRFPDLEESLPVLERLRIDVDSCVVFDQRSSLPPSIQRVNVTSQSMPVDVYEYLTDHAQDVCE
jgi:hypothetical protein